jgi:hypothetical protein
LNLTDGQLSCCQTGPCMGTYVRIRCHPMIRVHGVPISDDEASELARRLRNYRDPNGIGVAERLERGLMGMAIIGTSRPDAEAVLAVIEAWTPERPRELEGSLREFVGRAA